MLTLLYSGDAPLLANVHPKVEVLNEVLKYVPVFSNEPFTYIFKFVPEFHTP